MNILVKICITVRTNYICVKFQISDISSFRGDASTTFELKGNAKKFKMAAIDLISNPSTHYRSGKSQGDSIYMYVWSFSTLWSVVLDEMRAQHNVWRTEWRTDTARNVMTNVHLQIEGELIKPTNHQPVIYLSVSSM